MCMGLRGHNRLMRTMHEEMKVLYKKTLDEVYRLNTLFRDLCWYNFEVTCKSWEYPWHETVLDSPVVLLGWRQNPHGTSRPVYYSGPISKAGTVPVDIILKELIAARAESERALEQMRDVYSYAPGGDKYEEHINESQGARLYNILRVQRDNEQTEESDKEASNLLGRVCGNRQMV